MLDRSALSSSLTFMVILAAMVAISPFAIDTYLPVIPNIADDLNASVAAVNLTMSFYMLGNAVGQFVGGAISDQMGRKPVILVGLGIFLIASIGISIASSIEHIQLLRALQALGGGFATVACIAMLRDVFDASEFSKRLANIMLIMLVAPMIAPLIGAIISQSGWRTVFIFLSLYGFVCLLIYGLQIPETQPRKSGNFSLNTMMRDYWSAFTHRVNGHMTPALLLAFLGLSGAVFMSYLTNCASIYMGIFKLDKFEFSLLFASNVIGLMAGNRLARRLMEYADPVKVVGWSNTLMLACLAGLVAIAYFEIATFWPTTILFFFAISAGALITPTAGGLYLSHFDSLAGSASSLSTTVMFSCGAMVGAIASTITNGSLLGIFCTLLLSALLARLALVFIQRATINSDAIE